MTTIQRKIKLYDVEEYTKYPAYKVDMCMCLFLLCYEHHRYKFF